MARLADINPVLQEIGEWSVGERYTTNRLTGDRSLLGDNAFRIKLINEFLE